MLSLRIAVRYLFSPKSRSAVNVISWISLAGVAVAAAAMVVVLSVFNGFADLASGKLSRIDPDLSITPLQGKTIADADSLCRALREVEGVGEAWPVVTEQAFAANGREQMPVKLHAMPPEAARKLRPITIDGECGLTDSTAMLSVGVAMGLSARPSQQARLTLYEPRRRGRINPANPSSAFRSAVVEGRGVYQVEDDQFDRDMVVVSLPVARRLLDYTSEATSVSIEASEGTNVKVLRERILKVLPGETYAVADRATQQQASFRMIAIEKWVSFLMLVFILVIASFNIVASMSMLIIEKEPNMGIIRSMGGTTGLLRRVFTSQAVMITVGGGVVGIALGTLVSLGQQTYGWIRLSASNPGLLSVKAYPVVVSWPDLPAVFLALVGVSVAVAALTALILRQRLRRSTGVRG